MKKIYVGIFACCFLGALYAAEAASSSKDELSSGKTSRALSSIVYPFRKVTSEHPTIGASAPLPKASYSRSASPVAQATPSLETEHRKSPSPHVQLPITLLSRDYDDDARTVRTDGEGYESDGSTFDDKKHISAEILCKSRLFGGYGYYPVCALVTAIKKEHIPNTGKYAKIQDTPTFLAAALPHINTTASAEEFDTILKFVIDKKNKGTRLISRHYLSGTHDAAKRHEEDALAAAQLDEKATSEQNARVQKARDVLAAEEAKLAACKEKTLTHIPKLAQREATTHAVQALRLLERPQLLFGKSEFSEEEDAAAKLVPTDLAYEDLISAIKTRQELLRTTQRPGGQASSTGTQLK